MPIRTMIPVSVRGGEFTVPLVATENNGSVSLNVGDSFAMVIQFSDDGKITFEGQSGGSIDLEKYKSPNQKHQGSAIACDPRLIPIIFELVRIGGSLSTDGYFSAIEKEMQLAPGTIAASATDAEDVSRLLVEAAKSVGGSRP